MAGKAQCFYRSRRVLRIGLRAIPITQTFFVSDDVQQITRRLGQSFNFLYRPVSQDPFRHFDCDGIDGRVIHLKSRLRVAHGHTKSVTFRVALAPALKPFWVQTHDLRHPFTAIAAGNAADPDVNSSACNVRGTVSMGPGASISASSGAALRSRNRRADTSTLLSRLTIDLL